MTKKKWYVAAGFTLVSLALFSNSCTEQQVVAPPANSTVSSIQNTPGGNKFTTIYSESEGTNPMENKEVIALNYHNGQSEYPELKIRSVLRIPQQQASKNIAFRMSLLKEMFNKNIILDFGPDGIVFDKPALLNIEAIGLDLGDKEENAIGLFYDNNGKWQRVKTGGVIVDKEKGFVKIIDGELPHFSKYGIIAE